MPAVYDYVIIGGGIVGLSTAYALKRQHPDARLAIVEREPLWASHQTGHNSGVIHSGIYYKPGSFKARFTRAGCESMARFCEREDIPFDLCGKIIVATRESERAGLAALRERGRENGLSVRELSPAEAREIEPNVSCVAALHVPATGIVDYRQVSRALARRVTEAGGEAMLSTTVTGIRRTPGRQIIETNGDALETRFLINCAGLHSDRIARMAGIDPGVRIVPFRGEYYELRPERRSLVRHLIYPVPNPDFPFLGVHFTRGMDGSVHCGPNAVLALARHGYTKTSVNLFDLAETLGYRGFWRFAAKHLGEGLQEALRSVSKGRFTKSLQQLIPAVGEADIVPAPAGVRAQAVTVEGKLVDDFLIHARGDAVHVCNAPSPAATCALEIGEAVKAHVLSATAA